MKMFSFISHVGKKRHQPRRMWSGRPSSGEGGGRISLRGVNSGKEKEGYLYTGGGRVSCR